MAAQQQRRCREDYALLPRDCAAAPPFQVAAVKLRRRTACLALKAVSRSLFALRDQHALAQLLRYCFSWYKCLVHALRVPAGRLDCRRSCGQFARASLSPGAAPGPFSVGTIRGAQAASATRSSSLECQRTSRFQGNKTEYSRRGGGQTAVM